MLEWSLKGFAELSTGDLYDALALRQRVFVVEQNCPYQDCDGLDARALHLLGRSAPSGELLVYARLFAPNDQLQASIGRVVSHPEARRQGLGRVLMNRAILALEERFGPCVIRIAAQSYLRAFYESFGFRVVSEESFLVDNIPHYDMIREAAGGP